MAINWTDPNNLVGIDDNIEPILHKWLKDVMSVTEVTVTFTKLDGTERVMRCTLQPEKLPVVELTEGVKPRKETVSTKAIRVFDLDKQEWRSFTVKNLKRVELRS